MDRVDIVYTTAKSKEELQQIIELQHKNSIDVLEEEQKKKEGFVTVKHSLAILEEMNTACPHIIAKHNNKVVGYALCMTRNFSDKIPVLKPMFKEVETILPKNSNYIVMGQVCIDKYYRGKGVFRKLYITMQEKLSGKYTSIVTEIDLKNKRSLEAHQAVGFKSIHTYYALGQDWSIVQLKI